MPFVQVNSFSLKLVNEMARKLMGILVEEQNSQREISK